VVGDSREFRKIEKTGILTVCITNITEEEHGSLRTSFGQGTNKSSGGRFPQRRSRVRESP